MHFCLESTHLQKPTHILICSGNKNLVAYLETDKFDFRVTLRLNLTFYFDRSYI